MSSTPETAHLTIRLADVTRPVARPLYGIFFEDINHAADGGLYAELVRNRSFCDGLPPDGCRRTAAGTWITATGWEFPARDEGELPGWEATGGARIAADDGIYYHAANPRSLRLDIPGAANGGAANGGYWGIATTRSAPCRLRVFAKSAVGNQPLRARLVDAAGTTLADARLGSPTREWTGLQATLTPDATAGDGRLVIETDVPGTLWLGFVSLFPADAWRGRPNGLRADLVHKLSELRPAFVRFPGGCLVEGINPETMYDWKRTIGPVEERPGVWNLWGYRSTNGLGFHEMLELCEDLGADAMFVFNCGMQCQFRTPGPCVPIDALEPLLQNVLDACEYALGDPSTPWGRARTANGHPAPFPLRYLEIGNENTGPEYATRYRWFHERLKRARPELTLIANEPVAGAPLEIVDDHLYGSVPALHRAAHRYDAADRSGARIYLGEYAVTHPAELGCGSLKNAVAEAAFLTGLERNADLVTMSSYAPLFVNVQDRSWNPNLIQFDNHRCAPTPSYHMLKLFAANRGDVVLHTELQAGRVRTVTRGGIGFLTWDGQAEFRNVRVTAPDGTLLYANPLAGDWDGLQPVRGTWRFVDGALRQESRAQPSFCLLPGRTWDRYTFTCEARLLPGANALMLACHVRDERDHLRWQYGWNNTSTAVEQAHEGSVGLLTPQRPHRLEPGRWHAFTMRMQDGSLCCLLDEIPIHTISAADLEYPDLSAVATYDLSRREIILKLANALDCTRELQVHLPTPVRPPTTARVTLLTHADPNAQNTLEQPNCVLPREEFTSFSGADFTHRLPPVSVTVLRVPVELGLARRQGRHQDGVAIARTDSHGAH